MVQDDDSYQSKHVATVTTTNTVNNMIVTAGPFFSYNLFLDDFKGKDQTVRRTTTH
jgi:hypothetical protein